MFIEYCVNSNWMCYIFYWRWNKFSWYKSLSMIYNDNLNVNKRQDKKNMYNYITSQ